LFDGASVSAASLASAMSAPPAWSKPNVALVGFMGAGKSTLASLIAAGLGFDCLDTDRELERLTGTPVSSILQQQGEAAFRELESGVVKGIEAATGCVVSLGGGALSRTDTMTVLQRAALVVWLWADAATCWDRASDGTRPLLGSPDHAEALLATRTPQYARASDLVIDTTNATPEELAERVVDEIRNARQD
jgi:shikimate kinase